jgi:pimeloyl-ACP methyl ester carboxylesterase
LVSWGHGTSGVFAECGPSHIRNLWYQFSGPYALALAGYAVVGTDYAGLGVPFGFDAKPIVHQYIVSPSHGNDLLFAAKAAHAAFPDLLTEDFVVMGHSQGGGAAWAAAQQQLQEQVPGYLGAVAGSPVTDAARMSEVLDTSAGLLQIARSFLSLFPELSLSDMLTERGIAALELLEQVSGCNSVFSTLFAGLLTSDPTSPLTKDEYLENPYLAMFSDISRAGNKDFQGPLLVLQGTDDNATPDIVTTEFVNLTCANFPDRQLDYVIAEEVDHVPIMYATQQQWLAWLDKRFDKRSEEVGGCTVTHMGGTAPRPLTQYQGDLNYFLEYAVDGYTVA